MQVGDFVAMSLLVLIPFALFLFFVLRGTR